MEQYHGQPCWFELSTSDVDAAKAFYEPLMGWTVGASEMPDFDYRLARHGGDAVAGFMSLAALPPGTPPNWLTYIAVKNADETARLAVEKGGKVTKGPDDIPGTGRFAIAADPQGAAFGILQMVTGAFVAARRSNALTEILGDEVRDLATLSVAARQIRSMTRTSGTGSTATTSATSGAATRACSRRWRDA